MFDTSRNMRHLPFFTELATLDDADASWRAVSAGLVVLRLVDSCIEAGSDVVAADGWGVRSVRAAVEEMPAGVPARAILSGVVDALIESRGGDMHAVAPRLMAYARSLDLDARWALAADVYETVIAHVHPLEDEDVVVTAHLRRGHCLREVGSYQTAAAAFVTAGELAERCGDMIGMLRARIGEAKIVVARGNLPGADLILDETIVRATEYGLTEVRSMATHERAHVAYVRGRYDAAVRFAYDAMRDSTNPSERDRILGDLAAAFSQLGVRSAARDAFLILAATAREQYQRWVAGINLMEMAAEDGFNLEFGRYRQQLAGASLPPVLRAQFELHAGTGYQQLGDFSAARTWLDRANATASRHALNQVVFAVEAAMQLTSADLSNRSRPARFDIPREVQLIAAELKEMRESAGVS